MGRARVVRIARTFKVVHLGQVWLVYLNFCVLRFVSCSFVSVSMVCCDTNGSFARETTCVFSRKPVYVRYRGPVHNAVILQHH